MDNELKRQLYIYLLILAGVIALRWIIPEVLAPTLISPADAQEQPKLFIIEDEFNTYLESVPEAPDIWTGYEDLKLICTCESGRGTGEPQQFRIDNTPLWSDYGTPDVGACQINLTAHQKEIDKSGLDVINSKLDNIIFAKYLYDDQGVTPWEASRDCWGNLI